jgi:hypothetical protein
VRISERAYGARYRWQWWGPRLAEVVDADGAVFLAATGRHFDREGTTRVRLASGEVLSFPVSGVRPQRAVITVARDTGRVMMWCRWFRGRGFEIVVHPDVQLSDETLLLAFITSSLLGDFFDVPGGG